MKIIKSLVAPIALVVMVVLTYNVYADDPPPPNPPAVTVGTPTVDAPVAPTGVSTSPSTPSALVDPDTDPSALFDVAVRAYKAGAWHVLIGVVLIGVVWVARKYGKLKWPWLATKRGGAVLAVVMGFLLTLTGILATGMPFGMKAIGMAISVTTGGVGLRALLKAILEGEDDKPKPETAKP